LLSHISIVFGLSGEAEIAAAFVEAIVVDVVDEEIIGWIEDAAMHKDCYLHARVREGDGAHRVEGAARTVETPFVSAESVVIDFVNDGEPEKIEGNQADIRAEATLIIIKTGIV